MTDDLNTLGPIPIVCIAIGAACGIFWCMMRINNLETKIALVMKKNRIEELNQQLIKQTAEVKNVIDSECDSSD